MWMHIWRILRSFPGQLFVKRPGRESIFSNYWQSISWFRPRQIQLAGTCVDLASTTDTSLIARLVSTRLLGCIACNSKNCRN